MCGRGGIQHRHTRVAVQVYSLRKGACVGAGGPARRVAETPAVTAVVWAPGPGRRTQSHRQVGFQSAAWSELSAPYGSGGGATRTAAAPSTA